MAKGLLVLLFALVVQAISSYGSAVPGSWQSRRVGHSLRIVNGETAERWQFPHQAVIIVDNWFALCGGSLISKTWVLTAAHCIVDSGLSEFTVAFGAFNVRDPNEPGRITFTTRKTVVHEGYTYITSKDDVGLISLPEEVQLTDKINVIALPPRSYQHETFVGKIVRVSGWGKTRDETSVTSPILKFTDLTVVTNEECAPFVGAESMSEKVYCCRGANKKSVCNGDSGGPLTIGSGKNLTLFGIVSFGTVSCTSGDPTGFQAVTFYVDWISEKTGIAVHDV